MLEKEAWKLCLSFLEFSIPNTDQISHPGTWIKDAFTKVLDTKSILLLERGNGTILIPLSVFSIYLTSFLFLHLFDSWSYQHSQNVFHKMSFATTNFLRFHYYHFRQLSCNRNPIPDVAQSQSTQYLRKNATFVALSTCSASSGI